MCSSCRGSCGGCVDRCRCRGCCGRASVAQCRKYMEKLRGIDKYQWFDQCTTIEPPKCPGEGTDENANKCECIYRRNRHIIEALSCLFKCTIQYIVSMLFKLAYNQYQPLCRFPRDRVWEVMDHVKAPYTELNDLEIYDSMYDRCGLPIDPLNFDNIYKIMRMMFLSSVLTFDQEKYLLQMLQRLNDHAHCPVNLDLLLETIGSIDLQKLVCSIQNQEALTRRFYTSRQCDAICQLYSRVGTIDKKIIKRHRAVGQNKFNKNAASEHGDDGAAARQTVLNRQFCTRKPIDPADVGGSPSGLNRRSASQGSKSLRHSSVRYSKGIISKLI